MTDDKPKPLENGDCLKNCPYIEGENRCKVFCIKDIRSALEWAEKNIRENQEGANLDYELGRGYYLGLKEALDIYRQAFAAVLKDKSELLITTNECQISNSKEVEKE